MSGWPVRCQVLDTSLAPPFQTPRGLTEVWIEQYLHIVKLKELFDSIDQLDWEFTVIFSQVFGKFLILGYLLKAR